MNREEYLGRVRDNLAAFPSEERDNAIAYYREFFEDAGEDNEQAVIASLGTPEKLAENILKESGLNKDDKRTDEEIHSESNPVFTPPVSNKSPESRTDSSRIAVIVILLIITFPVWIGFVAGIFGVLFGLFVASIAIVFGFSVASVALIGVGIGWIFVSPVVALAVIGAGCILLGITVGLIYPLMKVIFKGLVSAVRGIILFIKNMFNKKEVCC